MKTQESPTNPHAAGKAAHTLTEDSPAYWNLPGAIPAVPGPYRVEHSNPGPGGFFRIMSRGQTEHGLPVAGSGCRIASLGYGGNQEVSHRATAAANAAFIVRACNSHAALVEALKAIREEATAYPEGGEDCFKYSLSLIAQQARAAIARATGQGGGE